MVPFVLPLVPVMLRALKPFSGRDMLTIPSWTPLKPSELVPVSIAASMVLVSIFAVVMFTALGDLMFMKVVSKEVAGWAKILILLSALIVALFGPLTSTIKGR